ncbi:MAG: siderophore-interacting protein [Pseudonocardiales bacterium]|nr:siderophore-interacting protein [Pseudonocardiales bacterium]
MPEGNPRRSRTPLVVAVVRTEQISPSMVRVIVGGPALSAFVLSDSTDSYVKVLFLHPGIDYPRPFDLDRVRAEIPAEYWPRVRSYTVRHWDPAALELTLDFVVHGAEGVAGPWAASAQPGDELLLQGPGGGYAPDPSAAWHLLVGDESALPAIAAALERLPSEADVRAFVEVHGPADELPLARAVNWVHRGDRVVGAGLVEAVLQADRPDGEAQVFVHGEAGFVKDLRRWLRVDLGLAKEQISISGYWRYGADDEGWRASKADWNREAEAAEAAPAY